jgi:hypothetical protein
MILPIIFGIIVLLITLYIIFYVIYPGSGNTDVLKTLTPLDSKKDIMMADVTQRTFLTSSGSSIMGFFYLKEGDRTTKYANSFIPLIQVENNWALEISPSLSGRAETSAQLRVATNDGGAIKQEVIDLPQIPKQKWIFIAILRDGRRFDIIYDNKIVASQRLEYYPVNISSSLSVGNNGLAGQVIHVMANGERLTPSQVERERLSHVDTNGTVLEADAINISFPSLKLLAQCPPGLPCDPITRPPSSNLMRWKTPYA